MADFFNEDGKPPRFNDVIRDVARTERIPLIDMRAAAYEYERHGVGPDGYHLSAPGNAYTSFDGDEQHYGRTLYELYALQVLHDLNTAFNS